MDRPCNERQSAVKPKCETDSSASSSRREREYSVRENGQAHMEESDMPRGELANDRSTRRYFLVTAMSGAGVALAACARSSAAPAEKGDSAPASEHDEAEVTPGEDLMQEHGVLERILLIYGETARRIERREPFDLAVIVNAAGIVRRFVEEYHEQTEERRVFPRLEAARREVERIGILRLQHQRGREITAELVRLAGAGTPTPRLAEAMRAFERMYRPHAAYEDTVLFPAFRSVVGGKGYHELGEEFEEEEHRRFGEHGFENTVAEVARLESTLGLADLARFTP
jgi:hemerythrin-like domain-containing protein